MMTKSTFGIVFLVGFFVLGPSSAQAQKDKLTIAYSSLGGSGAPVYIAQDKGFFDRNKLETTLIYIGGGRIVAQAFAAGQIKMAIMAGPALVSANLSGLNLRMVAGLVNHSSYTLFVNPSITSPRDLKGKKFGLGSFGGSPDFIIRYMLRHYGIDPEKDATILQLGGGGDLMRLAALKARSIDGALLSAPHPNAARVFANYLLSAEGQELIGVQFGRLPSRPGVKLKYPRMSIEGRRIHWSNPSVMAKNANRYAELFKSILGKEK